MIVFDEARILTIISEMFLDSNASIVYIAPFLQATLFFANQVLYACGKFFP